jgi:hypothetical protein
VPARRDPPLRGPHRNAVVVIALALAMAAVFVVSYTVALARPVAHHIPGGVVGDAAAHRDVIARLEAAVDGNGLALRTYASRAAAERAMEQQTIYAVLVLDGRRPRLLVASAAGSSVARLLEAAARTVSPPLAVTDRRPLPPGDPGGLVAFYATLAATVLGFTTMFQLRTNAPGLSRRGWLACIAAIALCGGLLIALVTDPLLGALHGPLGELWGALAAQAAVAALFNATMLTLIGRWAILPTWGFFVALGNACSGGAVAIPLLPVYDRVLARFMPNAAAFEAIRNAVYFPDAQHLEPLLVQGGWLTGALAAFVLATRATGRLPAPHQPDSANRPLARRQPHLGLAARRRWLGHHR